MNRHVVISGMMFTGASVVGFALAAMAFISIIGRDIGSENSSLVLLESVEGLAILIYLSLLALPGAFAGFGLLFDYEWGKPLANVLGAMSLIFFPIGTCLLYTSPSPRDPE